MRVKRKPILMNVWLNEPGKEPMPPWIRSIAEREAGPGRTFLIQPQGGKSILLRAGDYVVQGTKEIYPIDSETFKAEYEVINVQAKPEEKT